MRAVVLTIGDELLIGQVVNTNAAWLGEQLSDSGIDLLRIVAVGDDAEQLHRALTSATEDADLLILTGGLGPTHDDITRDVLSDFFNAPLRFDVDVYESIRLRFRFRNRHMPERNRTQAMVPDGFEVLPNPDGTAPGLWRSSTNRSRTEMVAVLPGVPHEMEALFRKEVLPRLAGSPDRRTIRHRTLRTAGIGESDLQEKIGDLSHLLSGFLRLAYLPGSAGVRLRLSASGESSTEVEGLLDRLEDAIRSRINPYIYGGDNDTLESVVGQLLLDRGLTIAVAESCTGGHVCHQITNVSGSSRYMSGGIIAYSNRIKIEILRVAPELLETEGAVSERVAREMAEGVRERLGANIGISTTGIAGPTGGTPDKPVGTVWIGLADAKGSRAELLHLVRHRILNKELTTTRVLEMVRRYLLSRPTS